MSQFDNANSKQKNKKNLIKTGTGGISRGRKLLKFKFNY